MDDVTKRRFITAGLTGFILMVPLAITSTAGWVRRLGGKRWQYLHRLIYVTAMAGVIHYYWLVKSDIRLPLMYGLILLVLLAYRFFTRPKKSISRRCTRMNATLEIPVGQPVSPAVSSTSAPVVLSGVHPRSSAANRPQPALLMNRLHRALQPLPAHHNRNGQLARPLRDRDNIHILL